MNKPRITIIAAMTLNRVIGKDNKLPWNIPADLEHFKNTTMCHHIVMGRKTYDSIGRPLPGRTTVVLTTKPIEVPFGVKIARSIDEAIDIGKDDSEIFFIGGANIYEQVLPIADRMVLTEIHTRVIEGDAFFPSFDKEEWFEVSRTKISANDLTGYPSDIHFIDLYKKKLIGEQIEPRMDGYWD